MGRVDDALRRAREEAEAAKAVGSVIDRTPDAAVDVPFPVEQSRPHPVLTASVDAAVAETADSAEESEAADAASASKAGRRQRLMDAVGGQMTSKLVADQTMAPGCREQYRRLAATLHQTQATSGLKVVLIASAVAGEGKTLTASNLALTFSESYKRTVLLIDGDLRRPSLHTVFRIEPTPGLSDGLMSAHHSKLPLHRVSERLSVLTAGRPTSDPMAALISDRMGQLIEEARETFDWVIIDTPPVGIMTDANLLASMADGTLLVVRAGLTHFQDVQRAMAALGRGRLLGVVLNRATLGPHEQKYYDYYYQRAETPSAQLTG